MQERDLERLLELYGVTDSSQRLAHLKLTHQLSARPWWHPHKDLLAGWLYSYLALESVADLIRTYENRFIPGLLQTRAHAEAVIRQGGARGHELDRRVDVRMNRQQRILERKAALWAVVDQATLSNQTADPAVMLEQIDFLIGMAGAGRREVSIRQEERDRCGSSLFLDGPCDCDPHNTAWSRLTVEANEPGERTLIGHVRSCWCGMRSTSPTGPQTSAASIDHPYEAAQPEPHNLVGPVTRRRARRGFRAATLHRCRDSPECQPRTGRDTDRD